MTVTVTSARPRGNRIAVHTYAVPVVRELPSQPADASSDLAWPSPIASRPS
jgi:hypothetical protein